jgi:hypothetical protein
MLRFAIAFALMKARKSVWGLPQGLAEQERYAVGARYANLSGLRGLSLVGAPTVSSCFR